MIDRRTFSDLAKISGSIEQQALTNRAQVIAAFEEYITRRIIDEMHLQSREEMKLRREEESFISYRETCRKELLEAELKYYKDQLAKETENLQKTIKQDPDIQKLEKTLEKLEKEKAIIDEKYEEAKKTKQEADKGFKKAASNINERRRTRFNDTLQDLLSQLQAQGIDPQNQDQVDRHEVQDDDDELFRTDDPYASSEVDDYEDDLLNRFLNLQRFANSDVGRTRKAADHDINEYHNATTNTLADIFAKFGRNAVAAKRNGKLEPVIDKDFNPQSLSTEKVDFDDLNKFNKQGNTASIDMQLYGAQSESKGNQIVLCRNELNQLRNKLQSSNVK